MAKKKLFDDKTDYAIAAFIVVVALMLGHCESAKADVALEYFHDSNAGTTAFNSGLDRICGRYLYVTGASLSFCPLMAVGGDINKGSFGLGFGDQFGRWEGQVNLNRFDGEMDGGFSVRRLIGDGPFKMALGGTYWINQSPGSSSNFTFNLGMRYIF